MHVYNIIIAAFVGVSRTLFDQTFNSAELRSQHLDLLVQEVLLLLQSIVLPLELNDLVFLVGCRHGHALTGTVIKCVTVALGRRVLFLCGIGLRWRHLICAHRRLFDQHISKVSIGGAGQASRILPLNPRLTHSADGAGQFPGLLLSEVAHHAQVGLVR